MTVLDAARRPGPGPGTRLDYRQRVCAAMDLISRNLHRDLALPEIAEVAGFSMFHFHRIFKAVVGETVAGFTRRLRLEAAASRLLGRPDESVTTIALGCGFSSSQRFARAFRQHFGLTPTEFRNRKKRHTDRNQGHDNGLRIGDAWDNGARQRANERRTTMPATIKTMPDYHVAYVRKMGPYGKETCDAAMQELIQWAGPRGFMDQGAVLEVYWDSPEVTPPAKCRVDACVEVPAGTRTTGQVGLQTIRGGRYGVCPFEMSGDDFHRCWEEAFAWLVDSGYECADQPCYELYHSAPDQNPAGKWLFDICIPLR